MLLTVTPNPCIERTVVISDFAVGASHRVAPQNLYLNAGGKGINAARVANQFEIETLALTWIGSNQRAWFENQLQRENVSAELVETASDTRVCFNVLDGRGAKTEIVEAGHWLEISDGTRLLEKYARILPRFSLVAICGSYPPDNPQNAEAFSLHLALLCRMAREAGVRVLLDSKGAPFHLALNDARERKARVWCIKPNISEAEEFLRRPLLSRDSEIGALNELLNFAEIVLLSCGERGCYFARRDSTKRVLKRDTIYFLHAPEVSEISSVGSGDALVGAFAAKVLQDEDELSALRWGVAAGAANAMQTQAGFCTQENIAALLEEVQIERL